MKVKRRFVQVGGWREYNAARNMRFPLRVGVFKDGGTGWVEDNPASVSSARGQGFGSWHNGGVQFGMCDGSVQMLSASIDLEVQHQLCDRSDGAVVDLADALN